MKHLKEFEDLVFERLGVPNQTEFYVNYFLAEIKDKIFPVLKKQEKFVLETNKRLEMELRAGREPEPVAVPHEELNGKMDFTKNPDLKFDTINYKVEISFVPGTQWGDGKDVACEGAYKPELNKAEGNYSINISLHLQYNENLVEKGLDGVVEEIITELSGTMYHEFNHAYEDFMRKSHGDPGLVIKGSLKNQMSSLKDYFEVPAAKQFFILLYLSISTEMNARVPQLIPSLKNAVTTAEKIEIIKNSNQWKMNDLLLHFKADPWLNDLADQLSFGGLLPKQVVMREIHGTINGMMDAIDSISSQGPEFIEHLKGITPDKQIYNWDDLAATYEKQAKLSKHLASRNPIEFFEYWQRVFNERGEYARRKLLRLAAY